MDAKESMSAVIRAIEMDSMYRVEDIVGRLIDLFNSDESHVFLENKIQQARYGLQTLEDAMEVSLYESMQAMQQLVKDARIHLWSTGSAISRFQFNSQNFHYLLTRATDVFNTSLSNQEKVQEIWDVITWTLTRNEDKKKAARSLEEFLDKWGRACKLSRAEKRRLENQIRRDFERGLQQQHSDIVDLFGQLRQHFQGLRLQVEEKTAAVRKKEGQGMRSGVKSVLPIAGTVGLIFIAVAAAPAIAAAAAVTAGGAIAGRRRAQLEVKVRGDERFLNRKDPS